MAEDGSEAGLRIGELNRVNSSAAVARHTLALEVRTIALQLALDKLEVRV